MEQDPNTKITNNLNYIQIKQNGDIFFSHLHTFVFHIIYSTYNEI